MGTYSNLVNTTTILPAKPSPAEDISSRQAQNGDSQNPAPSSVPHLPTLPYKRRTKRSSFEFYEDQLLLLRKLVYDAAVNGENLSQSDLVRMALDEFLKTKR